MDDKQKDDLWKEYEKTKNPSIREQLIIEYSGLVKIVAGRLGMYLGYWINMVGGVIFYFLASIWFKKRRAKFIDKKNFLRAGDEKWPKPQV